MPDLQAHADAVTHRLFLSYAGVDCAFASTVADALARRPDIDVFWDQTGLGWGEDWQRALEKELLSCDTFLLLASPGGVRHWTLAETRIALTRYFSAEAGELPLRILPLLLPGANADALPPFLGLFQAETWPADCAVDDIERFADWLSQALIASGHAAPRRRIVLADGQRPFRGLDSYQFDDAELFFGRRREVPELLYRLSQIEDGRVRRWLQIEGESGCGKTSLIQAGLLPAIDKGWHGLSGSDPCQWTIIPTMRPRKNVLWELTTVLERAFDGRYSQPEIRSRLDHEDNNNDALATLLRELRGSDERPLLLVIDQFEELLTVQEDAACAARFDQLLAAALRDEGSGLYLISGVRSDLLNFDKLPALQRVRNELGIQFQLNQVDESQLREIVFDLPDALGLTWGDENLAKEVLRLALQEPAPLPTLQYILDHLWEQGKNQQKLLRDHFDPKENDSLGRQLGDAAEQMLLGLDDQRRYALDLLLELSVPQGQNYVRRSLTYSEAVRVAGGDKIGTTVIQRLSGQWHEHRNPLQLVTVTTDADKRPQQVELVHEILLREGVCPTLWQHLENGRERFRARQLFELRVDDWSQRGSSSAARWRGLASRRDYRQFHDVSLSEKQRTAAKRYLNFSRRRHRLEYAALIVIAVLAGVGVDTAYGLQRQERDWGRNLSLQAVWQRILFRSQQANAWYRIWKSDFPRPDLVPINVPNGNNNALLESFEIGRYEVTFEEYDFFAYASESRFLDDEFGRERQPVINVSWNDATAYTVWLSKRLGKHCRLPNEAEWQRAALAGGSGDFGMGDDGNLINRQTLQDYAWTRGNSKVSAHAVGTRRPNAWGLHDMLGNVWEWTGDFHDENKNSYAVRGGSRYNFPSDARAVSRGFYLYPGDRFSYVGFRVVCVPHRKP